MTIGSNAQEMSFNTQKSILKWNSKKVTGEHWGYIKLKSGVITLKNDKIISGKFIIDMTSITNEDMQPGEWRDKLIGHLKSDDFFSVEKHQESALEVNESSPFIKEEATINGKLTIKGITHPITFKVTRSDKVYSAIVVVDRTKYNIKYGSGKFFEGLGDKMIYDEFTLDVKLIQ